MSMEGSIDTWENINMEEEHSEFSHDHSESYHAELHKEFSYDFELLGAYAMNYQLISPDDQYDDVVSLSHLSDWYISPIQSWIEAACTCTYRFGNQSVMKYYILMISHPARPFRIITQVFIF